MARHEGLEVQREWLQHGDECLASLEVDEAEVETWVDALYQAFEGVVVA